MLTILLIFLGTPGSAMNQYYSMSMPVQGFTNQQTQSMGTAYGSSFTSQKFNSLSSQSLENNGDGTEGRQRYVCFFSSSLISFL